MFKELFKKQKEEQPPSRIDLIIQKLSKFLEDEKVNIFELMDIANFVSRLTFQNFDNNLKASMKKIEELEKNAGEQKKQEGV